MKNRIFISLALVFISFNLIAGDGFTKEVKLTESKLEETVIYDEKTNEPVRKCVCQFNDNDQIVEKIIYQLNRYDNWVPSHKFAMTYSTAKTRTPCTVEYTKWDPTREKWEMYSKDMKCLE